MKTDTRSATTQINAQLEEMARALRILIPDGQIVELRVPKVDGKKGRTDSGYFSDMNLLARAAITYNRKAHGVYITPNPVNPALLARAVNRVQEWSETTTADSDIERRIWLLIDADPKRPSNISSSEEEHNAAIERVGRIRNWLTSAGWPAPVLADSGNGGHLLYRIDLPNNQDATTLVQQCLQALSALFNDETVTIDTTVFNAARIWKLYGTVAGKGDHTDDRPHRQSRLIEVPDELAIVPLEKLQELASRAPKPETNNQREYSGPRGEFDLDRWLSEHNLTGPKAAWQGGWRWKLDKCPFNDAHADGAFVAQLSSGAISAGCKHNSCQGKDWKALRELMEGPKVYTNGNSRNGTTSGKKYESLPSGQSPEDLQTYFLYQSADDEGNAQCVNKIHGADFLYCDAYGWMQNIGTHWIYGGLAEKEINLAITQTLIDRRVAAVKVDNEKIIKATKPSSANKESTKRQFKDIVWCDVGIFDQEKHLLNCQNGIIDLRTGQLITSEASNYFTYCVNAEYRLEVDTAPWVSFLSETIKDYEQIQGWLQMACGYSITGCTNEEIMFYNFGPARSGKGTFTNAFLYMLGQPLATGINFSTFTAKREGDSQNFDLAPLKPSRFIAASESGKHQSLNEAVIKQITGNDPIRASFKGKDHFTFFPQFKIWLSSNHPIKGDVDDDAFWGRIKGLEFPNSHLGDEDKSLKERVQTPEFCAMVLAWSVMGARMWHGAEKGLATPTSVQKTVADQRAQLDSVQRWLDECTKRMTNVDTANDALRKSYEDWCKQNGEAPKFAVQFGKSMSAKGFESTNVKVHGISKRGYKDIALLTPEPVDSSHQDRAPTVHWSE